MLEKVFYTSVLVSDQDKALDFYTNVLGLEKRVENPTPDGPRFLTVGVEGDDFQLVLWPGTPGQAEPAMGRPPASITIETDDCRKTVEDLKSRGVEFISDVLEFPWGYVAQFQDPDGNRLQVREGRSPSREAPETARPSASSATRSARPHRRRANTAFGVPGARLETLRRERARGTRHRRLPDSRHGCATHHALPRIARPGGHAPLLYAGARSGRGPVRGRVHRLRVRPGTGRLRAAGRRAHAARHGRGRRSRAEPWMRLTPRQYGPGTR